PASAVTPPNESCRSSSVSNAIRAAIVPRGSGSGAVRRVDPVEATEQSGPDQTASAHASRSGLSHLGIVAGDDVLADGDELAAARLRAHLHGARGLQVVHREERIGDRLADGEKAVVAEDQVRVVAEVLDQARLLVVVERDALE